MIRPNDLQLRQNGDGTATIIYEGWNVVTFTRQGRLMRHRSVGDDDFQTDEHGKIKLAKEPE